MTSDREREKLNRKVQLMDRMFEETDITKNDMTAGTDRLPSLLKH